MLRSVYIYTKLLSFTVSKIWMRPKISKGVTWHSPGGKLWPMGKPTLKHTPPKPISGCTERYNLLKVTRGCDQGTKKIREGTNSSISHPLPLCGIYGYGIFHVGSDGELNQTCQSSSESVQWFRSSREPKMTPVHWLSASPVQQRTH